MSTAGAPRTQNRHYVLFMVTLVFVVNYLDRQVLAILLPLIKAEFHVSDSALGLLTGPAFVVLYATLGVPLALMADRVNRRNLIAGSLALFSLMTVLCNYTVSFWQLLAARVGVGIGEAGTGPSINAIIADLYPPKERASALAIYSAGLNVGLLFAFFGGGWVAQHYGWRMAFLLAGLPGLVLVFLFLFTVEEPKRGYSEGLADGGAAPGLIATAKVLWGQRSFRFLSLGTSMSAFGGYAAIAFVPSFLARSHGMTPAQIGLLLSITTGIFGFIGTVLSGIVADRVGKGDIGRSMLVPVVATFIGLPFAPVFYLSPNLMFVMIALAIPAFLGASYLGPAYSATQGLVPLRMRATAAAILLFVLNMIGLGLGPLGVGILSDLLTPWLHQDALRWALLSTTITSLIGAFFYWQSSRTLAQDMARAAAL
ncbi:MAG TPA: MFS transporter [Rhizomicrobium sp.]|jgi:predicted MFS family arabinose efflux permease|nr:MFS transporter [Rhizomicrobium sp.]